MASETPIEIDDVFKFIDTVLSGYNRYVTEKIPAGDEAAPIDVVLQLADDFAKEYGRSKGNTNVRWLVLGALFMLIYQAAADEDDELDSDDPLMSKASTLQ